MTWVLGLHDGHDAGACLIRDGAVVFAVSEERLVRQKRASGFPERSIRCALEATGLESEQIETIVVSDRFGKALPRLLDPLYRRLDPDRGPLDVTSKVQASWQDLFARLPAAGPVESAAGRAAIAARLRRLGLGPARLSLVHHHDAHRSAAQWASGLDDPLVITLDGFGDGLSGTASIMDHGRPRTIARIPMSQSLGILYGEVNQLLGFSDGDEGKTLGLAAHGDPERLYPFFADILQIQDRSISISRPFRGYRLRKALVSAPPEDVAAALQKRIEEVIRRLVRALVARTGKRRLCCAGGLFANVELNRTIAEMDEIEALYVFPHMGDGGLCVGAAYQGWIDGHLEKGPPAPLPDPYLGPSFSAREVQEAIQRTGLEGRPVEDAAATILEIRTC